MNKYNIVCKILIMKDGKEVIVEINYKEFLIVYQVTQGLKVPELVPILKRKKQTIYNTINQLKDKLGVDTMPALTCKFNNIDFKKL